mgnify:CR=1 FL=1
MARRSWRDDLDLETLKARAGGGGGRGRGGRGRAAADPDPTTVQSLVFSRDDFTEAEALRWASSHSFKASKIDTTTNTRRIRQADPGDFDPASFRTIELTDGVQAVIGHRLAPGLEDLD